MKIGDYVRTKIGISKCIRVIPIRENSLMYEFDKEVYEDVNYLTASELKKYKLSPNIIDLIEVGDYVNGERVFSKHNNWDDKKYRILADSTEGYISEEHIYSVVTKEQFESMEYKI